MDQAQGNTRRKGDCRRRIERSRGISRNAIERKHGGWGVGEKTDEGVIKGNGFCDGV